MYTFFYIVEACPQQDRLDLAKSYEKRINESTNFLERDKLVKQLQKDFPYPESVVCMGQISFRIATRQNLVIPAPNSAAAITLRHVWDELGLGSKRNIKTSSQ